MTTDAIPIQDWRPKEYALGKHLVDLDLNKQPGEVDLGWRAFVVRGSADGPLFLVTAGVHGDEYEGMSGIRAFVGGLEPKELNGTVVAIPVIHEAAYEAALRSSPIDGMNLARTFPGEADGSPTQRIAHAIRFDLLPQCDFYCDLHSGGMHYEILPLSGYQLTTPAMIEKQRGACIAFDLPFVWGTALNAGRSLSAAFEAGVPSMYVEYGGGGACPPEDVEHCRGALRRVAAYLGMLEQDYPRQCRGTLVEDYSDDSGHLQVQGLVAAAGYFDPLVAVGDDVKKGELLGRIIDPLGGVLDSIRTTRDGRVVWLRKTRYIGEEECCFALV